MDVSTKANPPRGGFFIGENYMKSANALFRKVAEELGQVAELYRLDTERLVRRLHLSTHQGEGECRNHRPLGEREQVPQKRGSEHVAPELSRQWP